MIETDKNSIETDKNSIDESFCELVDLIHQFDVWCDAGDFYWHRVCDSGMVAGHRSGEIVEMVGLSYLDTLKTLRGKMMAIVNRCEHESEVRNKTS